MRFPFPHSHGSWHSAKNLGGLAPHFPKPLIRAAYVKQVMRTQARVR